jgi:hypothetical protein
MLTNYISTKTGNRLVRRENMFRFGSKSFSGLVDVKETALYDDPEDSFAAYIGVPSSLDMGLTKLSPISVLLDSEEFYNLMQTYRQAPMTDQVLVSTAYENVKKFLIDGSIMHYK